MLNHLDAPLKLTWTEQGYKVNKPNIDGGEFVDKDYAEKLMRSLESLTPGGSEFVNDPDYCIKYVKEFQASQHKLITELAQEKKQIKEILSAVLEWLEVSDSKKNGSHIRLIKSVLNNEPVSP